MTLTIARNTVSALAITLMAAMWVPAAKAQGPQQTAVIVENVRIFNGTSDRLSAPSNVLVVGNVIKTISVATIADPVATSVTRISGSGRTLMPGLIDAHTHLMFATIPQQALLVSDIGFVNLAAGRGATDTLMQALRVSVISVVRCSD
jgi:imidazolonepropionase-like amidohydrolase